MGDAFSVPFILSCLPRRRSWGFVTRSCPTYVCWNEEPLPFFGCFLLFQRNQSALTNCDAWSQSHAVKEGKSGAVEVERTKAKIIFLFSFLVYEFACKSEVLDIQWYLLCLVGVCWRCIAQFIFIRMHFWFFFAACTLVNITGFVTSCELACCQDNLCDPSAPTSASLALVANVCAILLANVLIIFAWFH